MKSHTHTLHDTSAHNNPSTHTHTLGSHSRTHLQAGDFQILAAGIIILSNEQPNGCFLVKFHYQTTEAT